MSALPQTSHGEDHTEYSETPSTILPAAPPPELDAAIDAAFQRANDLAAAGRELDFAVDAAGDLVIEIRDRSGARRTITPSQAVNLMGGLGQV